MTTVYALCAASFEAGILLTLAAVAIARKIGGRK